jgi:hypothetical protein
MFLGLPDPDSLVRGIAPDPSKFFLYKKILVFFSDRNRLVPLDISYCDYFDVWCLDRISGEYADTLEYLNISG